MVLYEEHTAGLKIIHYIGTNFMKKILCIEDERFISELYKRALEKVGYEVKIVADGEEGLHEAVNGNYDIILLDIMLPTMNGVDLLYKMKDKYVQPPISSKIIITTNLDQKEEVRKEVEKMADGYLIKAEITPRELVEYVQQVTGQ
jgi:DNA-binding response OmpR family regulator